MQDIDIYENVKFIYPFRDYQQRVLDSLYEKIQDNRIHIAAAPGSGKTVLGLEIIRRIGSRALVLVPSVNLREQWSDRFLNLFVREADREKWRGLISNDLDNPGILTFVTYQALYRRFNDDETGTEGENTESEGEAAGHKSENAGFERLKRLYMQKGITTICLDEAHHLKREWWKALQSWCQGVKYPTASREVFDPCGSRQYVQTNFGWLQACPLGSLLAEIKDSVIVSLTATPPYDSTDAEWFRYNELCGEIDMEIFIPEMVQKKCLCPHQDYVYLCVPTREEEERYTVSRREDEQRIAAILKSCEMYRHFKNHPALTNPENCIDTFCDEPDYLTALLSYAFNYVKDLSYEYEDDSAAAKAVYNGWHSDVKNVMASGKLPLMDERLFEILMRGILEYDTKSFDESFVEEIKNTLSKNHFLHNGKIVVKKSQERLDKLLKNSVSKLTAMENIVRQEIYSMKDGLRCVILTDHVRKEDLKKVETSELITDMGCVPIFERLRRMEHMENIGGYMAPVTEANPFEKRIYAQRLAMLCASFVIVPNGAGAALGVSYKELGNTGYICADITDGIRKNVVSKVTELLTQGVIQVLIGTAALLGEGWDAPCVNTVILGSVTSTYVSSNQMRGRALRIDKSNPDKAANIWHLATLSPVMSADGFLSQAPQGAVYQAVGVSPQEAVYEAGEEYKKLCRRFDTIVGISYDGRRIENGIARLGTDKYIYNNGICNKDNFTKNNHNRSSFTREGLENFNASSLKMAADRKKVKDQWENFIDKTGDLSTVRDVVYVPVRPRVLWRKTDARFSRSNITGFAKGLFNTMKEMSLLSGGVTLELQKNAGKIGVSLCNAKAKENAMFTKGLSQIFELGGRPRYVISRKNIFGKLQTYAVPDFLSRNKADANKFYQNVKGTGMKLVYVQSNAGKKYLLEARMKSLRTGTATVKMVRAVCKAKLKTNQ